MELMLQEEWRFVSVVYGEQCVIILGVIVMLELSAGDWDSWMNVSSYKSVIRLLHCNYLFLYSCNSIEKCQVWTGWRTNTFE